MGWIKRIWDHEDQAVSKRDLETAKVKAYRASEDVRKASMLLLTRVGELQREIQQEGGHK